MTTTCTRRFQFCAGHRVRGHENLCKNLHGHNYVVFVEAEAPLDALGRVIDFGVLKQLVGGWIDANWDHGFILWREDHQARILVEGMADQKMHLMPANPTAENMAAYLLTEVCPLVLKDTGVRATFVRVWETENCYADARL